MRILKIALITVIIGVVTVSLASCASRSSSTQASENQTATVQRGNLTIDITATGNLALSHKDDVAFETAGTVETVLVEVGQSVAAGETLVKLSLSDWQDQLTSLENQLTAAGRQLTAAQRNVTTAERNVTTAERKVTSAEGQVVAKERALLQAQVNLKNAQINEESAEDAWLDTVAGGAAVKQAKDYLEYTQSQLSQATTQADIEAWLKEVRDAQKKLSDAEARLEAVASESDKVAVAKLQVEIAEGNLTDAQTAIKDAKTSVEDAKTSVEDAKTAVEDAKTAVEDAQKGVEDAQEALDETKNASLEVKAPFTGFVTAVYVSPGGQVKKGASAVQLADPTKFEAEVLVSEQDIFSVKTGGDASVQVDAMSTLNLPAKVTRISPTATIQQGVVNYKVKVEIQSFQPAGQGQLGQGQRSQSVPSGQGLSALAQAIQLKEGLSVTVSILIMEKGNVILVPNRAITRQGRNTVVQVVKDGVVESRTITTGASDWQNTEVTDGLTEGEQVVIPQAAAATTTPGAGGMFRIPGVSR